MPKPKNIILVGFMATGKSHVGRILSEKTGWPLVDADDEIVRRTGKSIQCIFDDDGETAFRDLERLVIADLCAESQRIISAGGGAFVDAANRELMLASGLVVCLSATPETICSRVEEADGGTGPVRPLLAGDKPGENPLERIESLLAQRANAYAQAHHTLETDSITPQQVAERILELCRFKGF
ncbi:MAG: shikimate kinase [Chloroflexi bacterium]|nr:shikimate kinase [Chloroflexota bacterium]MDA1219817.1 shikimate kinase [Chloroflexota bacterium]